MNKPKLICSVFFLINFLIACSNETQIDSPSPDDQDMQLAESLIDAFYSFDPDTLRPLLIEAEESAPALLFYQGWAKGGNYKILNRVPCVRDKTNTILCAITVEDDPVLALNIDFKVTDTFAISLLANKITSVVTSSDDKPIYNQAFEWVVKENPEIMAGPCKGFFDGGPTPADCARAMTEGYRQFAKFQADSAIN